MEHRFSTHTIQVAGAIIVAIVVASVCLIPSKPADTEAVGIAANARVTRPLVLAQYHPCPNRC
jgi:hypothetical protein